MEYGRAKKNEIVHYYGELKKKLKLLEVFIEVLSHKVRKK